MRQQKAVGEARREAVETVDVTARAKSVECAGRQAGQPDYE